MKPSPAVTKKANRTAYNVRYSSHKTEPPKMPRLE